ncbi:glycosyltransferase [Aequorivita sediminis]|uniref:glycosyltransferase n=1 Tax=Aequorivita sediminis TaxID=3073653 RepID=UPI0028ACFB5F|nr:glycosyltransferase [Aequorivita sp. F6058]
MKLKLLFITHDTTRTGAPMVLLHFLRWLRKHQPQVGVDVLALRGGNMEEEFQENCSNYYNYSLQTKTTTLSIIQRILKKLHIYKQKNTKDVFLSNLAKNGYDVIYANTIVSIPIAVALKKISLKSKVLAHIHELNTVINQLLPNFNQYVESVDGFITASNLVANNLIKNRLIDSELVATIYECAIVDSNFKALPKKHNNFVVGASGHVSWRKGYDVFLQVASYINKHYDADNIIFEWVGNINKDVKFIIEADIEKMGLQNKVHFVGELENPNLKFSNFNVFLMTSREDPFPLVCIELGMLGKPIISFQNAVGTNEVIKDRGGFVVPYLDIEEMSKSVMKYYDDKNLIEEHGSYNKSAFSNFNPDLICPKYYAEILRVLDT